MDGKLARLRGVKSQFGGIVDQSFDMLKHGVGLTLVGLALSLKTDSAYPLAIILPYALYIGVAHINYITKAATSCRMKPEPESANDVKGSTRWQLFCDKRGLGYRVYTDVELIYIVILLIGINLQNPTLLLLVGVYVNSIRWIWKKLTTRAVSVCPS
jgi:phosphatidylglycerophosphate synthase